MNQKPEKEGGGLRRLNICSGAEDATVVQGLGLWI